MKFLCIFFLTSFLLGCSDEAVNCPDNYVPVSNFIFHSYTNAPFCVSKYEMKQEGNLPVSRPEGLPWVNIDRNSAIRACQALGEGYDLITNDESQALAIDIESSPANWSLGTVGLGNLNQGHSDGVPSNALEGPADDRLGCAGTGQKCNEEWHSQRRTHVLSNGKVIVDRAGNVWEWAKDDNHGLNFTYGPNAYISQITSSSHQQKGVIGEGPKRSAKKQFGPLGTYAGSDTNHRGMGYGFFNRPQRGILRGGDWTNLPEPFSAGIFATLLNYSPTFTSENIGFRCVFHPQ